MYVDPITCQILSYGNQIPRENNPQKSYRSWSDTNHFYVLKSGSFEKDPRQL